MPNPIALIILDGFGITSDKTHNAIAHASMPSFNSWLLHYPHTTLHASGNAVGLPKNFQGNSEVGHLTIGAGRIIKQTMSVWNDAIADGSFADNALLLSSFYALKKTTNTLHIIGLLSNAGIHGHIDQLYACIDNAARHNLKVIVHAILDGRDTPPQSAYNFLQKTELHCKQYNNVTIGSIHGRFYAMDRDHNWQRTKKSYRILTEPQPSTSLISWETILEKNYNQGITDEFIAPIQLQHTATIHNGDGILFCNIRSDRACQLTAAFTQPHFSHFIIKPLNLTCFITPVSYSAELPTTVLFKRPIITNTLKDVLADNNKTIFSIAETEKYAHVTYFFNGESEPPVNHDTRIMIPSLTVQTYKDYPEMSAQLITNAVINSLQSNPQDFYLINYANADMVGHSGDFNATVQAVEFLDTQLQQLYNAFITTMNGTVYITADHGKAEEMYDKIAHQPRTAHTANPVPFIMINKKYRDVSSILNLKGLADIAPFIVKNMGLKVPKEMIRKKQTQ